MNTTVSVQVLIDRIRERAHRILSQNASNTAKALAKDSLELCAQVDDLREELGLIGVGVVSRMEADGLWGATDNG